MITSPTTIVRADVPSCARTIVSVSVERAVTVTISAFDGSGYPAPDGNTVAWNGGAGNLPPCPDPTTSDAPEVAGDGAVATVEIARLARFGTVIPAPSSVRSS